MNNKQKRILQLFIIIVLLLLLYLIIKYFGRIDSIGNGGDTTKIDVFDIVILGEESEDKSEVKTVVKERSERINDEPIRNSLENWIEESEGKEINIINNVVPQNEIENVVNTNTVDTNTISENTVDTNTVDTNTVDTNTIETNTVEGTLIVHDEEVQYGNNTTVNIFKHFNEHRVDNRIAPEDSDVYSFYVRNNNPFDIIYRFSFGEINNDRINLKFRLKKNGNYIISDWVTGTELAASNMELGSKKYDKYELEWKWFEADNDTEIGEKEMASYYMDVFFYAVEK